MNRRALLAALQSAGKHMLSPGLNEIRVGPAVVEVAVSPASKTAEIVRVFVPPEFRGAGHARAAMVEALRKTDAEGLTTHLNAEPYGKTGGLTSPQLRSFYESLGYKKNAGRRKRYEFRATHYREPAA